MKWTHHKLETGAGGRHLSVTNASVNIIFVGGISDDTERYLHALERLLPDQAHIWTLDLRGFGLSSGATPGHFGHNGSQLIVQDITALCQKINNPHPTVIIGHSTGALFSLLALKSLPKPPEAIILSSAGLPPRWEIQLASLLFTFQKWTLGAKGISPWIRERTTLKYALELQLPPDADWRTEDPQVLESLSDYQSTHIEATVGSWCDILKSLKQLSNGIHHIPEVRCLLIGGADDPSTQFGVSVNRLSNTLVQADWTCFHRFITGARHDIWNGKVGEQSREAVHKFLNNFLSQG